MHHFHLTVGSVSAETLSELAKAMNLKATTIDLVRSTEEQTDRMLTGYLKDDDVPEGDFIPAYFKSVTDEVKAFCGADVIRVKLEEQFKSFDHLFENVAFYRLNKDKYLEFHFKIDKLLIDSISELSLPNARSENPAEMNYEFINVRTDNMQDTEILRDWFMDNRGLIRGAHMERLVYDSKASHDDGWIND